MVSPTGVRNENKPRDLLADIISQSQSVLCSEPEVGLDILARLAVFEGVSAIADKCFGALVQDQEVLAFFFLDGFVWL